MDEQTTRSVPHAQAHNLIERAWDILGTRDGDEVVPLLMVALAGAIAGYSPAETRAKNLAEVIRQLPGLVEHLAAGKPDGSGT